MCLYTKYITNKKYQPNRENNFKAPACQDKRLLLVPAKCGRCIECRKARKREWEIKKGMVRALGDSFIYDDTTYGNSLQIDGLHAWAAENDTGGATDGSWIS